MNRILLSAVAFLFVSVSAIAMTKRECASFWLEADLNRDGQLNVYEETSYLAMLRVANMTMVADGTFRDKLFPESCKTSILSSRRMEQVPDVVSDSGEEFLQASQSLAQ